MSGPTAVDVTRLARDVFGVDASTSVQIVLTDSKREDGLPLLTVEVYSTRRQGGNVPEQYRDHRRSVEVVYSGAGAPAFTSFSPTSVSHSRDGATAAAFEKLAGELSAELAKRGAA
jgi:hypothetical protein